ncbi:uncharacterized protein LOC127869879 [Dreissena polymorpha]|uniref:uncharacterized protein LOC127869879 n=1 Tax=Dreissena polymorpha TaxID=45954 RepID=UPI0022654941|nr:uncharacterized protein LOC127869879 [Dreissena polymorpha]
MQDFSSLAKAPIKFDVRQGLKIPFSKVPFVNIAREARECHYGPGRSKPKYTEPDDPNRERRRLRRIKKMGCPAIIKIKTVIYLPRFKVSDPVTKYKIRLAVNEMRTQEVRPEDKQMVFVLFCNKHQNHPGLKYTAASVSQGDIHDLVPEPISEEIVPADCSIESWLNSCKISKHVKSFHDRGYYFTRQLGHITFDVRMLRPFDKELFDLS